ncbi:MAG: radical SAM protein [Bdellovibrionota bacterium]
MAHIILCTFSGYPQTPSCFALDNGLASLAGILITNGHQVLIEDFNRLSVAEKFMHQDSTQNTVQDGGLNTAYPNVCSSVMDELFEQLATSIKQHNSTVVGFKCWAGDGLVAVKRWCSELRKRFPEIKILLGGPTCKIAPEFTAKTIEHFDFMVTNEGERAVPALLDHLEKGHPIEKAPGVLYVRNGKFIKTPVSLVDNLDEISHAVYDREVYPSAWGNDKLRLVVLDESRGCPMSCHFCVHPVISNRWRMRSVEGILAEISHVQKQLGARFFRFSGSYTPPKLLMDLSREIIKRGMDMRFSCFMHVNGVKEEYVPTFYEAGLRCIFFGVESADDELLKTAINKKTSSDRILRAIKSMSDQGVFVTGSFIYPLPFETTESRANTVSFLRHAFSYNQHASAQLLTPFPVPQTPWGLQRDHFGFEFDDDKYIHDLLTYAGARFNYDPGLRTSLPFKLNGKTHAELIADLSALTAELKNDDISFNISDDVAIIAIGCDIHPFEFKETVMPSLLSGRLDIIRTVIEKFNGNQCRRANPLPAHRRMKPAHGPLRNLAMNT